MKDDIGKLIDKLGASGPAGARSAGEELLRQGPRAVPRLLNELKGGPASGRKASAFLLGRLGPDARIVLALTEALGDEEPKVRKNSAVALGRLGDEESARALARALAREKIAWVRPSLLLALGKLGGPSAREALAMVTPATGEEREALRKALDRCLVVPDAVSWNRSAAPAARLYAAAPVGLEDLAIEEAAALGLPEPVLVDRGLLRFPGDVRAAGLPERLRCVHDLRLLIADRPSLHAMKEEEIPGRVAGVLHQPGFLHEWPKWLETTGPPLRYRFSIPGIRLRKEIFLATLEGVRKILKPLGLEDSPSSYTCEIIVDAGAGRTRFWFAPKFADDLRFAYRRADVGAAINPVVAACLARLVRTGEGGRVFDPTCGSATLLIERGKLDDDTMLKGADISPTAIGAAKKNIEAAGLANRISLQRCDVRAPSAWRPCTEVLANLPFGRRSSRQDMDLADLYRRLLDNLANNLLAGGRALLYSANKPLLHRTLKGGKAPLRIVGERTIQSGGLEIGLWLFGPGR